MIYQNAPVVQQTYDLLRESIPVINQFPRHQKFTLGDRLQNKLSDLLDLYIRALYTERKTKAPLLHEANIQLEVIRHYYRLAFDLGLYNSKKYRHFAEKLQTIGRMTGGWLKTLPNP